jgi:hypothetical protein
MPGQYSYILSVLMHYGKCTTKKTHYMYRTQRFRNYNWLTSICVGLDKYQSCTPGSVGEMSVCSTWPKYSLLGRPIHAEGAGVWRGCTIPPIDGGTG